MARAHAIRRSATTQGGGRKRSSLLLLLGVAVLSFAAGVLVGRREAPVVAAVSPAPASPRIAVVREGAGGALGAATAAANSGGKDLTFYETLTRETPAALGSGINSGSSATAMPAPAVAQVAAPTAAPPAAAEVAAPFPAPAGKAVVTAKPAVPAKTPIPAPAASPARGSYVLQAAAYRNKGEADKLKKKLAGKGYPVFVEAADLGSKGQWQRVYVGPFGDSGAAEAARQKLATQDKISAMVRKR